MSAKALLFHEEVALQRHRRHTCSKNKNLPLLLLQFYFDQERNEQNLILQTFFFFLTIFGHCWSHHQHNHQTNCRTVLTFKCFVSAKNVICSSCKWQFYTCYCLLFVPWALHSSCANLRPVMTPMLLPANEISLRSKVRGGLSCAKPFQYLRLGPLKRRLMRVYTCYSFASVHMMCKPFHPSAWHSWSACTNPTKSLGDPWCYFSASIRTN